MEKINNKYQNLFVIIITIFIFFWDTKNLINLNLKFVILLGYIFVLNDFKNFCFNFFNYKSLIFVLIFFHLLFNNNFKISFYEIQTFIFLILISFLIVYYQKQILLCLKKSIFIFIIILALVYLAYFFYIDNKFDYLPSLVNFFNNKKFIFIENSHFAMIATSTIFYLLYELRINNQKIILIPLIFIIFVAYLNFSLTLFVGIVISSAILIISNIRKIKRSQFLVQILLILISIFVISNNLSSTHKLNILKDIAFNKLDKTKRGDQSIEVLNISYKVMYHSIKTKPLGYGFNKYPKAFEDHFYKINYIFDKNEKNKLDHKDLAFLNNKDASNNFVKIVVETGIFSLIFFYFLIRFIFSSKINIQTKLLILPNFLVQTFLRGAGYFNGGYIIYLVLIIIIVHEVHKKKEKKII